MNITEGVVYTRRPAKVIWGNKLKVADAELDTNAYAPDDCLHENLITFSNVFFNVERGVSTLKRVLVKTYGTTLWKPDFRLLLFNKSECDIAPVINAPFDWGVVCKGEHILASVDVVAADYVQHSNNPGLPVTQYADGITAELNRILDNETLDTTKAKSLDLVGVAVAKSVGQFVAGAWLKIGLEVEHG